MSPLDLLLWTIAAVMALVTALLVRAGSEARTPIAAATVLFLLAMMAAMFVAALVALAGPWPDRLAVGLWVGALLMSASVFPLLAVVVRETQARRRQPPEAPAPTLRSPVAYRIGVIALVLANELLMGASFLLAAGLPVVQLASQGLWAVVAVIDSPWFLFTMGAEMAVSCYLLRDRLGRAALVLLGSQSAIMLLAPPAIDSVGWVLVSVVASSAVMTALIVYLMEHIYRHPQLPPALSDYLPRLCVVFAVMMAGLFLWQLDGFGLLFAAAILLEMALFFDAVLLPERLSEGVGEPWQLRPRWAFALLGSIFVAELFMGAALDVALLPSTYPDALLGGPLTGAPSDVAVQVIANGFWFVAGVTASTWFLVMMGLEMGALAVFKLRESRNRENRVRLGLMIGSYAVFATFYPSTYFALVQPNAPDPSQVPLLGWSMGLGSYPVAAAAFGVIVATYVIMGAMSILFGRRAICSVFCTAPLMYQGTAIDAMKSFNRSSPIARRYLSSRMGGVYLATTAVTMSGLALVSVASYLDSIGRWSVTVLGADPSVFFFAFSFSVLWYAGFVAIPYLGNYNCVTMGWCYTGTIAQAFQRIGFFKLKVRDSAVCRACTTLDCAKACPIGLVDMPGHFRTKGEFRSSKCCGVGGCVGACPNGNLYISDVRHWLRRATTRPPQLLLPMTGTIVGRRGVTDRTRSEAAPAPRPPSASP